MDPKYFTFGFFVAVFLVLSAITLAFVAMTNAETPVAGDDHH